MVHDAFASFGVKNTFSCSFLNLLHFGGKIKAPLTPALAPGASTRGNTVYLFEALTLKKIYFKHMIWNTVCHHATFRDRLVTSICSTVYPCRGTRGWQSLQDPMTGSENPVISVVDAVAPLDLRRMRAIPETCTVSSL